MPVSHRSGPSDLAKRTFNTISESISFASNTLILNRLAESGVFNWSTLDATFGALVGTHGSLVRICRFTLLPFDTDTKGVKYLKRVVLTAFLRLTGAQSPPGTRRTAAALPGHTTCDTCRQTSNTKRLTPSPVLRLPPLNVPFLWYGGLFYPWFAFFMGGSEGSGVRVRMALSVSFSRK